LEQPTVVCQVSVVTVDFQAIFKDVLVRNVVLMALTSALVPVFLYLPNTSFFSFLADRTNGRAIGKMLRPSSVAVAVIVCDVMYCG